MRIVVLKQGCCVVRHGDQEFLFGVPKGTREALKESGINVPDVVFTTNLRAPGYGDLGKSVIHFKEKAFLGSGISIEPIEQKHGTDYKIKTDDGIILYSERGDVSANDVEGFHLSITKNQHPCKAFKENVITWPWPDAEYLLKDNLLTPIVTQTSIALKVWSSMDDVPDNFKKIDGASLSLDQANYIARVAAASGENGKENYGIAISSFKNSYKKQGDKWIKKETDAQTSEKQEDVNKKPQSEVNYTEAVSADDTKRCANCQFYLPGEINGGQNGTCELVEGIIDASYVCDLFQTPGSTVATKELKDSKGRTANDYLIVEDPEKVTTWHLAVRQNGKIDHGLMGGAAAALTSPEGSRGNPYAGPDKTKAIRKLGALYNSEKLDMPEDLKNAYERLKEYDETTKQPIKRLGDYFIASLHTTYNDIADKWLKKGMINQEERIAIAKSIGDGLDAINKSFPKAVYDRICQEEDDDDEGEHVPMMFKEMAPNVPDDIDGQWSSVYKSEDGTIRWVSISSVAVWDKQNELFSTKAMDWAIAFAKATGNYGPLRYKHIPGLDGGKCDTMVRVGDFLFESGYFYDTDIGLAMKSKLENDPDKWQISVGLAYGPADIINGEYERAAIFERTMTQIPANPMAVIN